MFYIFRRNVGGRIHDTYIEDYKDAESYMLWWIEDCRLAGWSIGRTDKGFNIDKGLGYYDVYGTTPDGEDAVWSLLEGHFTYPYTPKKSN